MLRFGLSHSTQKYLEQQHLLPYTYATVGASRLTESVAKFDNDFLKVAIGRGKDDFQRAKKALTLWKMFPEGWTRILPENAPIREHVVVAIYARVMGYWWRNACRIVYVVDEPDCFGFANGTLPGHMECGEELFCVILGANDVVWYEIRAFSRPRHVLARLFYPWLRFLQAKFRRDSATQMRAWIAQQGTT